MMIAVAKSEIIIALAGRMRDKAKSMDKARSILPIKCSSKGDNVFALPPELGSSAA